VTNVVDDAAITLANVTKRFGNVEALCGVEFSVERGQIYGFLGPNGAGKTTTIRVLTGFIKADAGAARVLGRDAWRDSVEIKRHLGFLPDTISFGRGLTGEAFLGHMARLRGIHGTPPMQRELLDRLELADAALKRNVKGYSTGMAKKLALVQAMQHAPELLIMDEPTESLDPLIRQVLFALFRELQARGTTIFMSSHMLVDMEEICGRVALIRDGQIVKTGVVDDLRVGQARTMLVTLRDPGATLRLNGAHVVERDGASVRLSVDGDINDVVRSLADVDLADIVYERTSLEELFLSYYRGDETDAPSGDSASGDAPDSNPQAGAPDAGVVDD
jgi:ABC-2 type transport system ATP-binding protein